jgi:hypothetical protein
VSRNSQSVVTHRHSDALIDTAEMETMKIIIPTASEERLRAAGSRCMADAGYAQ